MTPALVTSIVTAIVAIGSGIAALMAYARSSRMAESRAISVTVEAAEGVVNLVSAQLERSMNDYLALSARLDTVETALAEEQGRTTSLNMQLGKMRLRVSQLEEFIKAQGWTPPPPTTEDP